MHPGLHEPIIDRGTWEQVQARLSEQVQGERCGSRTASLSPLAGKVSDASGRALNASHACKGTRRYRYYVSGPDAPGSSLRIPAPELEAAVAACLVSALDDPLELCARAWLQVPVERTGELAHAAAELAARLRQRSRDLLRELVSSVCVHEDSVEVECDAGELAELLGAKLADHAHSTFTLRSEVRLQRSGLAVRLVQASGAGIDISPSVSLIRLVVKARCWWAVLRRGEIDVTRLAEREGVTSSYLTRVVRLAFLSPVVVEAILAGATKASVDGEMLTATGAISPDWAQQAQKLLPAASR